MRIEEILIILFLAAVAGNTIHWRLRRTNDWLCLPLAGWHRAVFVLWTLAMGVSAGASFLNWLPFLTFLLITMGFNIAIQLYSIWARRSREAAGA